MRGSLTSKLMQKIILIPNESACYLTYGPVTQVLNVHFSATLHDS
jgi:hypothetical protein